ncbi:MAG: 3',5'-cyclic-AMP phosphodiesterase [Gammaproteobacteria bacterium]|nr:MAG: 3',5'-cyclic-AMP phosphodiesterase [Gammaproteobacteria bacterium]
MATNGPDTESRPLRIVQITDTHLYSDPDGQLLGLNTLHSLERVIDRVLNAQQPDLVVASGDLTHDGSPQAYRHVRDCFRRISAPVYCLPGNHDETATLNASMNSDPFLSVRSTRVDNWQMLFLDSTVAGSEDGHLGEIELDALDATLASSPDLPTLIWLHHQPVPIGSRWLDSMAVDNPQAFFDITDRYAQVRAIIWGHVHQLFEQQRHGVQLFATPSTCVQFLPGSENFAVDLVPPGYRWLELYPDGSLRTGVDRLREIPGEINPDARGY